MSTTTEQDNAARSAALQQNAAVDRRVAELRAMRTSSREEIAANVRAFMSRRNVEQQDLAQVLGKSNAAVSDRVNGKTHFRIDELQRVAARLDVTLDQLLEPEPEPVRA